MEREDLIIGDNFMAAYLLEERKKRKENPKHKSHWSSYFDIVPVDGYSDFPVSYTKEELELVKGCERILFEVSYRSAIV